MSFMDTVLPTTIQINHVSVTSNTNSSGLHSVDVGEPVQSVLPDKRVRHREFMVGSRHSKHCLVVSNGTKLFFTRISAENMTFNMKAQGSRPTGLQLHQEIVQCLTSGEYQFISRPIIIFRLLMEHTER